MADAVKNNVERKIGINLIKPNELLRGMARHPEICCVIITFLITFIIKYGTSFKGKPVTQQPKQPQYMFPPSSFVVDSPRGSLMPLIDILNSQEFVFVMYYAPWCYKSKAARSEFLKAANYFQGQVVFAAVNCWWPEGDCRKRYKFLMFPVFMAYHTKLDGYRYFGHVRAEHMIQFLEDLIYPLQILDSRDGVLDLVAKHEKVVIGYFNLTSIDNVGPYRQFYYASMRIQERDPFQPIKFAVVTQEAVALEVNLTQFNEIILLRMTNSSLFYPYSNNITSTNIIKWALENKGPSLIKRLIPEGIKSEVLATEMNKGPAIILFHVESPLFKIEHGLRVLKDVVLSYRECRLQPHFRGIWPYWRKAVMDTLHHHRALGSFCEKLKRTIRTQVLEVTCCICTIIYNSSLIENVCNVCQHSSELNKCHISPQHLLSTLRHAHPPSSSCRSIILNYSWAERMSVCCNPSGGPYPGSPDRPVPHLSEKWRLNISGADQPVYHHINNGSSESFARRTPDMYIRQQLDVLPRRLCHRLLLDKHADSTSPAFYEGLALELNTDTVQQGLKHLSRTGCSSNKSLNFYAIDSVHGWMFSDALGIESNVSAEGMPTAVLFDKENEEHYVFREKFTYSNTLSFILDYKEGRLKRHQNSDGFRPRECERPGEVCVQELTSSTFLSAVLEEDKDVVVLVYAHWCGFCQTFSHTFLALAHYFSTSRHISFARINGATNDLPWEYTFDSYPTIVLFPAKQKADSIVFPAEEDLSLTNLIRFVLYHATSDTRLLLAADVCSTSCIQSNIRRSAQLLQSLRLREAALEEKLGAGLSEDQSAEGHHARLDRDFLSGQLRKTKSQIEAVKKLKLYLQDHGDGINKDDLSQMLTIT